MDIDNIGEETRKTIDPTKVINEVRMKVGSDFFEGVVKRLARKKKYDPVTLACEMRSQVWRVNRIFSVLREAKLIERFPFQKKRLADPKWVYGINERFVDTLKDILTEGKLWDLGIIGEEDVVDYYGKISKAERELFLRDDFHLVSKYHKLIVHEAESDKTLEGIYPVKRRKMTLAYRIPRILQKSGELKTLDLIEKLRLKNEPANTRKVARVLKELRKIGILGKVGHYHTLVRKRRVVLEYTA